MSSYFNCSYIARSSLTYIPFFRRPSVNISHFNLLRNHWANCNQILVEWSLGGPAWKCVRWSRLPTKNRKRGDEIHIKTILSGTSSSIRNFDGIVIGWSFSKIVSGSRTLPPRWPPQCSCVVIESNFHPGERLQAPRSLWLQFTKPVVNPCRIGDRLVWIVR